jgi:hypothetical protein
MICSFDNNLCARVCEDKHAREFLILTLMVCSGYQGSSVIYPTVLP